MLTLAGGALEAQKAQPNGNGGGGPNGTTIVPTLSVSSAGAVVYGSNVVFNSSVVPSTCAPNAIATFYDNGSTIGTLTWGSSGFASFTASGLGAGTHSITVSFGGNMIGTTTCKPAISSPPYSQVVSQESATISVANLPSSGTYGGSFTASYSYSGNESPSESVSSSTPSVCSVQNNAVSYINTGTCTLIATASATADYAAATGPAQSFTVGDAASTISWPSPAPITYGTALSAVQLNATASVPGTFTYSPQAATILNVGTYTLSVTFVPNDNSQYSTATATIPLTVNQANPMISWQRPSAIASGTPLSSTQLDATANISGTFAYSPGIGTVLSTGHQTLSVTLTPADSTNYQSASATTTLDVNPPPPPCPVY